ncbi:MAG TPA: heparinase II/III family protein, partial [Fibrobacteria bacterium]|nr:heparinase II/III family protein [Fibrobacteria bacterium]
SLLIADVLMDAYGISRDPKYLLAARAHIVDLLKEERRRYWPDGFLWNDHAIAGRIPVLARFWGLYRNHAGFDPGDATLILQGAARSALMLSKPGAFTFATNHGVMQNLALLHFCAAFPGLDGNGAFRKTAVERLSAQMRFYVSDSGVVMEHSLGYHDFGLSLVGMGLRYFELLGLEIPPVWAAKYEGMKRFHQLITRPDGTLPLYGDTEWMHHPEPLVADLEKGGGPLRPLRYRMPADTGYLDPVAAYAIFWDTLAGDPGDSRDPQAAPALAQTLLAWPNFASRAHKRADEMSLHFWARGNDWWTGIGYWPYGMAHRDKAEGWDGSNAPHAIGERPEVGRITRPVRYARGNGAHSLELERRTAEGYRARRQLVFMQPGIWIVLDAVSDSLGRGSRIDWALFPALAARGLGGNRFAFEDTGTHASMRVAYDVRKPGPVPVKLVSGSDNPFAGWTAIGNAIRKTHSLLFALSGRSQSILAWGLDSLGKTLESASLSDYAEDGSWRAAIVVAGDTLHLECGAAALDIRPSNGKSGVAGQRLDLRPVSVPEGEYAAMTGGFAALSGRYARYPESYSPYRLKWSGILLALFLAQEIFFLILRLFPPSVGTAARALSVPAWAGASAWLSMVYFAY